MKTCFVQQLALVCESYRLSRLSKVITLSMMKIPHALSTGVFENVFLLNARRINKVLAVSLLNKLLGEKSE